MNKVIFIGRLTKEPILKISGNGTSICNFTIAVNRTFKRDGESNADFFNIVAFGKRAESCSKYLSKGSLVSVSGSIQNNSYIGTDNVKKYRTDVMSNEIIFLSKLNENNLKENENNKEENIFQSNENNIPFSDYEGDMPF